MVYWFYNRRDLKATPSAQDGIVQETEMRYRKEGARFIMDLGNKIGLRYDTVATGVVFMHRFYMFHSFKEFDRYVSGCSYPEWDRGCKGFARFCCLLFVD